MPGAVLLRDDPVRRSSRKAAARLSVAEVVGVVHHIAEPGILSGAEEVRAAHMVVGAKLEGGLTGSLMLEEAGRTESAPAEGRNVADMPCGVRSAEASGLDDRLEEDSRVRTVSNVWVEFPSGLQAMLAADIQVDS